MAARPPVPAAPTLASTATFARLGVAAALLAGVTGARAQQVDPSASELVFVTRLMGTPVQGRFTRWRAQVQFDPRRPSEAQVELHIDMTSVRFAAAEVSAEAQRPVWFDAAQFPEARFQSTAVEPLAGNRFEVSGRLELKGRAQEIRVPVAWAPAGSSGVASGSFEVRRLDHGIGAGEWSDASLVAHAVRVRFRITLVALPGASTP